MFYFKFLWLKFLKIKKGLKSKFNVYNHELWLIAMTECFINQCWRSVKCVLSFSFLPSSTFTNTIRIQDNQITQQQQTCKTLKGKWTKSEDEKLKNLCLSLGTENWSVVANHFPYRTEVQCQQRWRKVSNISFLYIFVSIVDYLNVSFTGLYCLGDDNSNKNWKRNV